MTTYRQYRCNLCQDFIKPTNNAPKEGYGVHFFGGGRENNQPWLALKSPLDCENHICIDCLKALRAQIMATN